MSVRAKFVCQMVAKSFGGLESITLMAANGKTDSANAQWSKWTPSGKLEMSISNPDAQGRFEPGKYYFLDIAETTEEA